MSEFGVSDSPCNTSTKNECGVNLHYVKVGLSRCRKYTPSTRDTYPFLNPYPHVNTVTMSELIFTSSAYIIPGDSPMTSVANTVQVAMTTLAVHTLQPLIFYNWKMNSPERSNIQVAKAPWTLRQRWCDWWTRRRAAPRRLRLRLSTRRPRPDANRRVVRRATP